MRAFTTCPREHSTRSFFANRSGDLLRTIFCIFVLSLPVMMAAQQAGPILFHGIILDADTHQPLTGAHFLSSSGVAGASDNRGMISFFARHNDTITFSSVGYKDFLLVIGDTLLAREYVAGIYLITDTLMIPAVIVIPRLGNIRAEIMAAKPTVNDDMVNASNNLRLSAYQGITTAATLGDPNTNYELLRQKQRLDAYEKGMIPADKMVVFSPFTIIPLVYVLAKGLPEQPKPPVPYLSERELQQLRTMHDSLVYKRK